jgi:zinc carboxypeptidase
MRGVHAAAASWVRTCAAARSAPVGAAALARRAAWPAPPCRAARVRRAAWAGPLCALAFAVPARAACPPVPAPPPANHPASAARADAYVRAVARASPVVRTALAGRSVQGRPLRYAVVSALPGVRLRAGLARLRAVRAGRARSAGGAPAVVWLAGSVHGNEPSGTDAELRLLHGLARHCHDRLLRRVVVVVMPVQNPDGHEAHMRTNANGFDLNRDWLTVTQPETQARMQALLAMPPVAFADHHEQGGDAFFFPPYAPPLFHELPDAALSAERDVLGPALRRAFARRRVTSTSGEGFDLLYPGYSDSATTLLFGAAGMTLEAGAEQPYAVRVTEQLLAARTIVEAAASHRATLLRAWARSFAQAARQGARGELQHRSRPRVYGYALGAGADPLVRLLLSEGVKVRRLAAPASVAAYRPYAGAGRAARAMLAAGTYVVSSAQPLKHWLEALLGAKPYAGGPSSSDVGAWSRPLLMGVAGGAIGSPLPPAPAAAPPPAVAAQPLAGHRIALLADPSAGAAIRPGLDQPNAGTSWARWVLSQRLGAQVDLVDGASLAAGAPAGHDAMVVADGSPPALSTPALQAIAAFVSAGGTYVGWRTRGIEVAHAAGLTPATVDPLPGAIRIPGAAVAVGDTVVLDDDDPLIAGGHVVTTYGAVLSGWASGSPAGRPAILDERLGTGRAVLFSFDPVFRASTEGAERLLTTALLGSV